MQWPKKLVSQYETVTRAWQCMTSHVASQDSRAAARLLGRRDEDYCRFVCRCFTIVMFVFFCKLQAGTTVQASTYGTYGTYNMLLLLESRHGTYM